MIGVKSGADPDTIHEFFQLFKTPWECYRPDRRYEAVLSTDPDELLPNAGTVILSSSAGGAFDSQARMTWERREGTHAVVFQGVELPIYSRCLGFVSAESPLLPFAGGAGSAGYRIEGQGATVYRLGYNVFDEARHLMGNGQDPAHAAVPALEIHFDVLRHCLMDSGTPFVEIPPVFPGSPFFVCLTHDVDFLRIRDHFLDHTFFGFVYRAGLGELGRFLKGRGSFRRLFANWAALAKLPLVYLGLAPDTWFQFARYAAREKGLGATYFFVPGKGDPGIGLQGGAAPARRATRYDVADARQAVEDLVRQGFEVGVHGVDAWHDPEAAARERERVAACSRQAADGIRMHWLYWGRQSPQALEAAGFHYDSTVGFNEAVGFKAGTAQPYRLPGSRDLLELPMVLQDTALFYPDRLGLAEGEALRAVEALVDSLRRHGGALTVNWHHRSIAPERLWDRFYDELLDRLQAAGGRFCSAGEAVGWYRGRRRIAFREVEFIEDGVRLRLHSPDDLPDRFALRVYHPLFGGQGAQAPPCRDFEFTGRLEATLKFDPIHLN